MYSKTCPIPVKNVRDKLIEMTPLSSLLSDWDVNLLEGMGEAELTDANKVYIY